jgi:bifunctional non-homologous end joining protein LigD
MRLASLSEPFDSADWIFELKYDGFRAVAEITDGDCRLFSRNRNVYRRFARLAHSLARVIEAETVLDGEIVCLDAEGRPQFNDLLRRRVDPSSSPSTS